jgi:hypothetical protein
VHPSGSAIVVLQPLPAHAAQTPGAPSAYVPLVGAAATPSGSCTWQAGLDGGVITTGDAAFYGSAPGENVVLKAPIVGIAEP